MSCACIDHFLLFLDEFGSYELSIEGSEIAI